jgi:hypothetical protein
MDATNEVNISFSAIPPQEFAPTNILTQRKQLLNVPVLGKGKKPQQRKAASLI